MANVFEDQESIPFLNDSVNSIQAFTKGKYSAMFNRTTQKL